MWRSLLQNYYGKIDYNTLWTCEEAYKLNYVLKKLFLEVETSLVSA